MSRHVIKPPRRDIFAPYEFAMKGRWRVEKAGSARGAGYGSGWFATSYRTDVGAFFPSWREAMDFALAEVGLVNEQTC